MLIASFNATTGWAGKTITFDDEQFMLEGHGRVSPKNIMKYDEKGQLEWATDGTRAWVGSKMPSQDHSQVILVASFNATTGWAGKTITHDKGRFFLQDHGEVSARNVLKYDAEGQLTWANEDMRAWVLSRANDLGAERMASRSAGAAGGQQPGLQTPWGTLSPLSIIGLALVAVGLITAFYFMTSFDTSVPVDSGGYDLGVDRVNNIGLQNDQQNGIIGGLVVAVVGGVLLVVSYMRGELAGFLSKAPGTGDRKCPYCAETIKADAVVCRFCNRDVPLPAQDGFNV